VLTAREQNVLDAIEPGEVAVIVFGPGSVVEEAHRPDESVSFAEATTAARAYTYARCGCSSCR
jgi:hypothetical protein